jgi:hypothetical protein
MTAIFIVAKIEYFLRGGGGFPLGYNLRFTPTPSAGTPRNAPNNHGFIKDNFYKRVLLESESK